MAKHVWVQDRNLAQVVKWQPWEYLLDTLERVQSHKETVIPKARQLGLSWLLAGYAVWKVLFSSASKGLILSQGETEAWEFLGKCKFIYHHLPDFIKEAFPMKHVESQEVMDFHSHTSLLRALPSTEKAGRSTDASFVIRDECAYHPNAKQNFAAIGPTIDAGDAQLIDLSTVYKLDTENHFTERVNRARLGENNAHLIDLANWRLRPVRARGMSLDEWFKKQIKSKYDDWEIEQEYPESLSQALSAPKVTCRFDTNALAEMLNECKKPLREEFNGRVKIYRESVAGRRYCFPVDPSEGSYDPALGVIIDAETHEEVAKYYGKIPIDEQARIISELYTRYNKPYTAPERNASGLTLIEKLKDMGIANFYHSDKAKQKPGFWTSSATRPVMLQDLAENIRLRQYRIYDEVEVREFQSFVRTDRHPNGVALGGTHDEAPMVWGIYAMMRKQLPSGEMKITSMKYGER
jgi:hypothetical protein|tara:strand:- start:22059 stop:23453 length:1395 start_codon:yes stop_codon:yes gene_type:complete